MANAPGLPHLWSISGEEQFYLVYPFLLVFLNRRAFIAAMIGILFISPPARVLLGIWMGGGSFDPSRVARAVEFCTPVHFDAFAAGGLIALITDGRHVSRRAGWLAMLGGGGLLLLYVAVYATMQSASLAHFGIDAFRDLLSGDVAGQYREAVAYTVIWMASAGLLIGVLADLPPIAMVCRPRIFHAIGKISYGGYVYHGFAIELLTRFLPGINGGSVVKRLVFLALIYSLAMAMAAASYRWIERPFLRLKPR